MDSVGKGIGRGQAVGIGEHHRSQPRLKPYQPQSGVAMATSVTGALDSSSSSDALDSSSSSDFILPSWVLLDPYVFTRVDLLSWKEDETTSPQCCTSQNDPFRVSFCFVAPPAISRFYLHVRGGNLSEDRGSQCRILSCHRNTLLFCLYVPLPVPVEYLSDPEDEPFPQCFKQDLFIYTAGHIPSLELLPSCPRSREEESLGEELYDPLAEIIQFSSDAEALGVLCNDRGECAVAYLCVNREISIGSEDIEAKLFVYYSSSSIWQFHGLPISCQNKDISALLSWSTNGTVAYGSYLCWIDYQCGILFCELFGENPRVSYLSLPMDHHVYPSVAMTLYRNISVVQDGGAPKLKFIDVRPSCGYGNYAHSDGFEINYWTLVMENGQMNWKHEHEFVLEENELCDSKVVPSHHGPLKFPIVSIEEPDIAYFVVDELRCRFKKVWLVPVDLFSRSVKYLLPYLNGEDDLLTDDADMARRKCQCFEPFLPSEIIKFFKQINGDSTAVMKAPDALPNCKVSVHPYVPKPDMGRLYMHSGASMESAQNMLPQIGFPQNVTDIQTKAYQQVSFRLLCPINLVGGLIGMRGKIIRGIEYETGARIDISACAGGCSERVITIAAIESPDECSKVQGALLRIFERLAELERNAHWMLDQPFQFYARALVHEREFGAAAMNEIMNMSRTKIEILKERDVPACASRCERVLQIAGGLINVSYALCLISWKLRNQIFCSSRVSLLQR